MAIQSDYYSASLLDIFTKVMDQWGVALVIHGYVFERCLQQIEDNTIN